MADTNPRCLRLHLFGVAVLLRAEKIVGSSDFYYLAREVVRRVDKAHPLIRVGISSVACTCAVLGKHLGVKAWILMRRIPPFSSVSKAVRLFALPIHIGRIAK